MADIKEPAFKPKEWIRQEILQSPEYARMREDLVKANAELPPKLRKSSRQIQTILNRFVKEELEKARMREWFVANGKPVPARYQPGYATSVIINLPNHNQGSDGSLFDMADGPGSEKQAA
jgi:hypothetical protein